MRLRALRTKTPRPTGRVRRGMDSPAETRKPVKTGSVLRGQAPIRVFVLIRGWPAHARLAHSCIRRRPLVVVGWAFVDRRLTRLRAHYEPESAALRARACRKHDAQCRATRHEPAPGSQIVLTSASRRRILRQARRACQGQPVQAVLPLLRVGTHLPADDPGSPTSVMHRQPLFTGGHAWYANAGLCTSLSPSLVGQDTHRHVGGI